MSSVLVWAIAALCLLAMFTWLLMPPNISRPQLEMPTPRPTSGPHSIVAHGRVDEGHFVVLRTPLYEHPLNAALMTQVLFDPSGTMARARYLRVETLQTGKLVAGHHLGRSLVIPIGPGNETATFTDDPETTWTH